MPPGIDVSSSMGGTARTSTCGLSQARLKLSKIQCGVVTMPHKGDYGRVLDEVMTPRQVAGSCNAIAWPRRPKTYGDMFDGGSACSGVKRKGRILHGRARARCWQRRRRLRERASLAKAGVARVAIFDDDARAMNRLAERFARALIRR